MVVWHVTTVIMLVIISLLEDEHELSLGMLTCPKRIYNFCLLHACFVCVCHVLLELSYTFDHIWTNLLTQCTYLSVPVFCCFCISGFSAIKSVPGSFRSHQGRKVVDPPGSQEGAWRPPGPRHLPSWLPCGPPRCPLW